MRIELDGAGQVNFRAPQQQWFGDSPEVMQTASFAGHKMTAITDDNGAYDLHYLNFQAGGFKTIEDAKHAAPEFARKVLARMSEMIAD
ncbi:MAG TPA: hypothetical protein VEC35_09210 [Noviherbaspirillum sp.]|nr:hypothetical protein [Noviherbaspirillum sp.]